VIEQWLLGLWDVHMRLGERIKLAYPNIILFFPLVADSNASLNHLEFLFFSFVLFICSFFFFLLTNAKRIATNILEQSRKSSDISGFSFSASLNPFKCALQSLLACHVEKMKEFHLENSKIIHAGSCYIYFHLFCCFFFPCFLNIFMEMSE